MVKRNIIRNLPNPTSFSEVCHCVNLGLANLKTVTFEEMLFGTKVAALLFLIKPFSIDCFTFFHRKKIGRLTFVQQDRDLWVLLPNSSHWPSDCRPNYWVKLYWVDQTLSRQKLFSTKRHDTSIAILISARNLTEE